MGHRVKTSGSFLFLPYALCPMPSAISRLLLERFAEAAAQRHHVSVEGRRHFVRQTFEQPNHALVLGRGVGKETCDSVPVCGGLQLVNETITIFLFSILTQE